MAGSCKKTPCCRRTLMGGQTCANVHMQFTKGALGPDALEWVLEGLKQGSKSTSHPLRGAGSVGSLRPATTLSGDCTSAMDGARAALGRTGTGETVASADTQRPASAFSLAFDGATRRMLALASASAGMGSEHGAMLLRALLHPAVPQASATPSLLSHCCFVLEDCLPERRNRAATTAPAAAPEESATEKRASQGTCTWAAFALCDGPRAARPRLSRAVVGLSRALDRLDKGKWDIWPREYSSVCLYGNAVEQTLLVKGAALKPAVRHDSCCHVPLRHGPCRKHLW